MAVEQRITAQAVKTRLETLDSALEKAQGLTQGYESAPKYVSHTTRYLRVKLGDLRYTLDNLRAKIPDRFQSERR
ncbi:hypothetical protein ES703_39850 [subsurface metagenome]